MSATARAVLLPAQKITERVSVFGLGKVGLALAASLAEGGCRVIGVDPDKTAVTNLNHGVPRTVEPGVLQRIQHAAGRNLTGTSDPFEAVAESDFTFVIVPTPSNALGGFSLRHVLPACEQIGAALRRKNAYHVVAVVSTMLPGSSQHFVMPHLERAAGRKIGEDLGYCYNPAFIALGEVAKGFELPDYVLIGQSDPRAGDRALSVHRSMVRNSAPVARMSPTEAEITKIASNTHETMRVSFANMLFSLCTEIPGANVDRITGALSHRMGKRFFKGAVPYGGPCFPRDNVALAIFMDAVGVPSTMPRTVDLFNLEHGKYILRKILEITRRGEAVGILGLSYKPGTPVIERAFGIDLAAWLTAEGRRVIGWDPFAISEARAVLGDTVAFAESADDCLRSSKTVVIVNAMPELNLIDWTLAPDLAVVDCWRCLKPEQIALLNDYRPLGCGISHNGETLLDKLDPARLRLLTD
jgi:UDPglucose 6-dehydrogenase